MKKITPVLALAVIFASHAHAQTTSTATQPAPDSPYEKAFQQRAQFILKSTAARDTDSMIASFEKSDYFKNAGGDAHKYAMPPVLAKLALNPNDEAALRAYRYLQDVAEKKPDRALYHFATFQRARLYFQLKDKLPQWVRETNEYDAANFMKIMLGNPNSESHGTDNHATMNRLNGLLWAQHLGGEKPDSPLHDAATFLLGWAERQNKKYHSVGMGEYDSSTYIGFGVASWANLYDFSPNPDTRQLARAALDWQAASMALKYFHGLTLGPESRGFADEPVGSLETKPAGRGTESFQFGHSGTYTDWCSWLWWNDSDRKVLLDQKPELVETSPFPVQILALSTYRTPEIIRNIATKNVKLPFEAKNSKPSYYGMNDNKDQEYLYFSQNFAMGTLYSGDDGIATTGTILPQTTMFKLAIRTGTDVLTFGMSQGYHKHYPVEGRSPFSQYHQHGAAAIMLNVVDSKDVDALKERITEKKWPDANLQAHSILAVPKALPGPVIKIAREGRGANWFFWQIGKAYVAASPLGDAASFIDLPEREKSKDKDYHRWLVSPGTFSGWVIQAGEQADYPDFDAFQKAVLSKSIGISKFDGTISYTSLAGDTLTIRHTGKLGDKPDATTNGKKLVYKDWPVFQSPYINQAVNSGILRLTDGKNSLTIDCTNLPPKFTTTENPRK